MLVALIGVVFSESVSLPNAAVRVRNCHSCRGLFRRAQTGNMVDTENASKILALKITIVPTTVSQTNGSSKPLEDAEPRSAGVPPAGWPG
jgi:hypothetical protein